MIQSPPNTTPGARLKHAGIHPPHSFPDLSTDAILVALEGKRSYIRVMGRGCFQNSPELKTFAMEMINRGGREFVLDLEKCPVMDSTFMGTLTGIAQRLMGLGQGSLSVIHSNERNRDLLANLGLDQLFDVYDDDGGLSTGSSPRDVALGTSQLSKEERAELMLEAHEALSDISAENEHKFKDVVEFLRQDLNVQPK